MGVDRGRRIGSHVSNTEAERACVAASYGTSHHHHGCFSILQQPVYLYFVHATSDMMQQTE
eukprot:1136999-Pelagomonas_calceolata.AAC.2